MPRPPHPPRRRAALVAGFAVLATVVLPVVHSVGHHLDHVHTPFGAVYVRGFAHDRGAQPHAKHHHAHEHDADGHRRVHDHERDAPRRSPEHHGDGAPEHASALVGVQAFHLDPVLSSASLPGELERGSLVAFVPSGRRDVERCRGPPVIGLLST